MYIFWSCLTRLLGFPGGSAVKNLPANAGFGPWVRKILWKGKWQSTPVFSPGKSHGQRSLVGYRPWGRTQFSDWTTITRLLVLSSFFKKTGFLVQSCFSRVWLFATLWTAALPPGSSVHGRCLSHLNSGHDYVFWKEFYFSFKFEF